jgi:hypothetical protein
MFRHYDTAMKEFCTRKMPGGSEVPVVGPVSPLRAFAAMNLLLKDDPRVKKDPRFIPLPFISFDRLNPILAQERYNTAEFRKLRYSDDMNSTLNATRQMPYDIPYAIEIWAEKEDDAVYLLEGFIRRWRRPLASIKVWHGEPFGDWNIYMAPPMIVDNSIKSPDKGDREIRYTLTVTLEGFMTFPAYKVPTVRGIGINYEASNKPLSDPDDIVTETQVITNEVGEETQ